MNTHEVINQSPVFENVNLYELDAIMQSLVKKQDISWIEDKLKNYGKQWIYRGKLANEYTPKFHTHNTKGFRVDEVEFHQSYHDLMQLAIKNEVHSLPWVSQQKNAHVARLFLNYLDNQNEAGTSCPLTMTFSAVPPLKKYFPQADEWLPKILNQQYDPSNKPYFEKKGLTIGMAMTEKQGGTDVRANTTVAVPENTRERGAVYHLTGHKWFCSAPMCDGFLTLAQTEGGLSCFLFPRWKPNGTKNNFRIQRLKDKLGNKSNASSEIEFDGALAWLVGDEGRGVPTIIEMVALTRYDCMIGSSGLMRRGLSEVLHHIKYRSVLGKELINQPLMRNVVADLCLESEASLAMTYRVAQCLDNSQDKEEQLLLRLLTPIGKFWITKRAITFLGEAMECLGGNGYVEDSILPRLYREAPVNAIWEGSGNVQCLDVLRAFHKSPEIKDVLFRFLDQEKGKIDTYDMYVERLKNRINSTKNMESNARIMASEMALSIQASLMIKYSTEESALAFCETRLTGGAGYQFGYLTEEKWIDHILERNSM
jgi:putative acyl-CoA dehydrogenase